MPRSPFPWFYSIFFMVMIIHRTGRDIARCRRKYGKAWEEYERRVPYLFIPVSCAIPPRRHIINLTYTSTSSRGLGGYMGGWGWGWRVPG